jgi:hypothetical protein
VGTGNLVVEAHPRTPLPFGLSSVVAYRASSDPHWENGIEWEPLTCDPVSGRSANCPAPSGGIIGLPKGFAPPGGVAEASPFSVLGTYKCGPIGHDLSYAQEMATAHLLAREESRVEQALWTGDLGNTPALAPGATDLNAAGAVDAVSAIGLLENFIARAYGSLGTIHMSRGAANAAIAAGAVYDRGGKLYTSLGTPVVAGSGYPGTSPAGAAPAAGEEWIYASPAIFGYRSGVIYSTSREGDLMDRGRNDLYAVAERTYVLGFDECGGTAAVRMTLGCAC